MTEHTRWRIEDEPDLVKRDGCLLALGICFMFWAVVVVAVMWSLWW